MMNRRDLLGAAGLLGLATLAGEAVAAQPQAGAPAATGGAQGAGPPATLPPGARVPQLQFVYECDVTLLAPIDFGDMPDGHRRIIPITGGTFKGPEVSGIVVPGGADWNLQRRDGAGTVEAAYYLRTDDGVNLRITNKGVSAANRVADPDAPERFSMFTVPTFEAPPGKYDWMNRTTFVGTLGGRKGVANAVLIRVFKLV
jgi:hypothetical protein